MYRISDEGECPPKRASHAAAFAVVGAAGMVLLGCVVPVRRRVHQFPLRP